MEPLPPWVSVTDVVKRVLNPGEPLLKWANRVGREGKTLEQARGGGKATGRFVHTGADALARGQEPPYETAPAAAQGFLRSLSGWAQERRVVAVEASFRHPVLRYTGRVDWIELCQVDGCRCYGEGAWIKDFKTGGVFTEAHLQLDGYVEAWPHAGYVPEHVCGAAAVALYADGRPGVEHSMAVQRGAFAAGLELYRKLAG